MRLIKHKASYVVPVFEEIEAMILVFPRGMRIPLCLISREELRRMQRKQDEYYCHPDYASYQREGDIATLIVWPTPNENYELKIRYIETKEF